MNYLTAKYNRYGHRWARRPRRIARRFQPITIRFSINKQNRRAMKMERRRGAGPQRSAAPFANWWQEMRLYFSGPARVRQSDTDALMSRLGIGPFQD